MRFVIALAGLLSGASSSIIDDTDDFENAMPGNLEKIDVFGVLASSPSSSNSKEEESFVRSSANDHKVNESSPLKKITHGIESREIQNSLLLDKEDNENKGKVVTTLDEHSTNSKQIELCSNILGVTNSCSSKEDICVPLTEHQQSILSVETKMAMYLTDEEKRELGICLDLSSIEVFDSLTRDGDASTATVVDDEDGHNFYLAPEHYSDDKDKALMLDGTSTTNSKKIELCSNVLGVVSTCSSKEDVCVPLTEEDLSELADSMAMDKTYKEKRELGICKDLSSIGALELVALDGHASTATVADDEDILRFYLGLEQYSLDTDYGASLYTNDEVNDLRHLQSDNDCDLFCAGIDRPVIQVDGSDFRVLINNCIGDDTSSCPDSYRVPLNCWNTTNVTDMSKAFDHAFNFNKPLGCWDTAKVKDMFAMFDSAYEFNQPIESWDTANVINMSGMFMFASAFNQPIQSWETSEVEDMSYMFSGARKFNQPIESWDTANVMDMTYMFLGARNFNQPIQSWDTANVMDMRRMFFIAIAFNQPIQSWETSEVEDMSFMFFNAIAFNQPIESWDVSKVESMRDMFGDATEFNQCLSTWANKTGSVNTNRMFYGSGCPSQSDPVPITGPWCQSYVDSCFALGFEPSVSPSSLPSTPPSTSSSPSASPSTEPSVSPSASPSTAPSTSPSASPSTAPSISPSASPSTAPSTSPSASPSTAPSTSPSASPSTEPFVSSSAMPSASPSAAPIRSKKEKKTNKRAKHTVAPTQSKKAKKTKQSKK